MALTKKTIDADLNIAKAIDREHGGVRDCQTSSSVGYTPGPYSYHYRRSGQERFWEILAPGGFPAIATIYFSGVADEGILCQMEADARLLAAAPDLLEALRIADAFLAKQELSDYAAVQTRQLIRQSVGKAVAGKDETSQLEHLSV